MFKSSVSASSVTKSCFHKFTFRFGQKVVVVDTPGIFDTSQTNAQVQDEIAKCIAIACPGPHAFILVLSIGRFTEEEQNSIEHCIKYFGENIYKYAIIVFTCKDNLDLENKPLYEYIKSAPARLRDLIKKCEGRVCAFNNRLKEQERYDQAIELLNLISKKDSTFYTNEMYQEAEETLKKEENEMKRKAREDHEREWQRIEQQIAKKYEGEFAEKNKELQNSRERLDCLKNEKIIDEYQNKLLKEKIKDIENKQKESEGKEKEKLQNTLTQLQGNLAESKIVARRKEDEMNAIRKSYVEKEKEIENLKKQSKIDLEKIKEKLEKSFHKDLNTLRDEIRKLIEEDKSFLNLLKKMGNVIYDKIFG